MEKLNISQAVDKNMKHLVIQKIGTFSFYIIKFNVNLVYAFNSIPIKEKKVKNENLQAFKTNTKVIKKFFKNILSSYDNYKNDYSLGYKIIKTDTNILLNLMLIQDLKNGNFKIMFLKELDKRYKGNIEKILKKDFDIKKCFYHEKYYQDKILVNDENIHYIANGMDLDNFEEYFFKRNSEEKMFVYISIEENAKKIREIIKRENYKSFNSTELKSIATEIENSLKDDFGFIDFQLVPTEFLTLDDLFED